MYNSAQSLETESEKYEIWPGENAMQCEERKKKREATCRSSRKREGEERKGRKDVMEIRVLRCCFIVVAPSV
jgi:hypothetical protein